MFWRRKARVAPYVDIYIRRRYEDMAVCIHADIASNKGLLCYYTQWLDQMMVKFDLPEEYRSRHSLVATDSHGKHVGCSGATSNRLEDYNPPEHKGTLQRSQSLEARIKSRLSARFQDSMSIDERIRHSCETTSRSSIKERPYSCKTSDAQLFSSGEDHTPPEGLLWGYKQQRVDDYNYRKERCNCSEPHNMPGESPKLLLHSSPQSESSHHSHLHQSDSSVHKTAHACSHDIAGFAEGGLVVSGDDSRPQTVDSYCARRDDPFQKHGTDSARIREPWYVRSEQGSKSKQIISCHSNSEDECIRDSGAGSFHAVELDENKQPRRTRTKFCTIL